MTAIRPPMGVRRDPRPHLVLLLCSLVGAFVLCAATARAATLTVSGPAGAEIFVDGESVGTLPLAGPVTVEPGVVQVECRKPGHLVHREDVKIDGPETTVTLRIALQELSRARAVGSSVVLAGLGQLYQGRPRTGWTMVALQGTAWLVAAAAEGSFQSARDDYEVLQRQYEDAVLEAEIVRLRNERDAAYDDLESARDLRRLALGSVLVVGLWSVFDAWRAHDGFFADVDVPAHAGLASARAANGTEALLWRVGWRKDF